MTWISEHLAPLMFMGMILFMLIGYPAAFSLAATGLFFGFLGIEFGLIRPDFLGNLTYQLFGIVSNDAHGSPDEIATYFGSSAPAISAMRSRCAGIALQ